MSFLINNWEYILLIAAVVMLAIVNIRNFLGLPTEKQLEKVKAWLLLAIAEAEKIFGSGTGQLKLRYVYDLFLSKFPSIAKLISFEKFSELVDMVLIQFNHLLSTNERIQEFVEETEEIEE